jgi:regulator of RNase E activity RraA
VPGRINWPVSVGGVTVNPGDLVVADGDGVVVVEPAKVPAALDEASKNWTTRPRAWKASAAAAAAPELAGRRAAQGRRAGRRRNAVSAVLDQGAGATSCW